MSLNRKVDRENVIPLHSGRLLYSVVENNNTIKFCREINGTIKKVIFIYETQAQKDKHGMYSLISGYQL